MKQKSLQTAVQEYLHLRYRMGFKLIDETRTLTQFVLFMKKKKAAYITINLALEFATKNPLSSPTRRSVVLGAIRQFALYWSVIDPRTQIPPLNILPSSYHRQKPFIYSENDIIKLLNCCKMIPSKHELLPLTYFTFFGLLAVTGIRISEAIALKIESVDFKNDNITIHDSKLHKSRHVPVDPSTTKALRQYAKLRDRCFPDSTTSFFL